MWRQRQKERRGNHFIYFKKLLHRIVKTGTSESSMLYLKAGDPGRGDISVHISLGDGYLKKNFFFFQAFSLEKMRPTHITEVIYLKTTDLNVNHI